MSGKTWRILGSPKIGIVLGGGLKTYIFKRPPGTIPILVITVAVPRIEIGEQKMFDRPKDRREILVKNQKIFLAEKR